MSLQIGAVIIALALSASAASAQTKYRADDGTFIHVDYDVRWFTFTDSEEIGDFEGAAEFGGELVDCEDRAYQCIAMEGWIFAIPRDRSQLSWTVSGSDFQRINSAAVSEIIDVRVSAGGEEYSSFSFDPERGITGLLGPASNEESG